MGVRADARMDHDGGAEKTDRIFEVVALLCEEIKP